MFAGYEVLLTVDQGFAHQQNFSARNISVVLIRSRTNQLEDLAPLAASIQDVLKTIKRGDVVCVG